MARAGDWEQAAMAQGDPSPTWIMPGVKPEFSLTSFAGGRPFLCSGDECERWHVGVDLNGPKDGQVVIAPEAGVIIGVDKGWDEGSKATYLRTPAGLFLLFGGMKLGSGKEFGIKAGVEVKKGQPIGRVLGSYKRIHFETYDDKDGARTANTKWYVNKPLPANLLNPTWYAQLMAQQKPAHLTTRQKLEALAKLGWYKGSVTAPWGVDAIDALKAAQKAYGLTGDGVWGEKTEAAIQHALAGGNLPKPPPKVDPLPLPGDKPKPGDQLPAPPVNVPAGIGWGGVVAGVAAIAAAGGVAYVLSSGKKSSGRRRR